ncbi:MAG: alginate lyase family protein [Alphaproteobacteria bacterium]|jgi:uncharacterized heparinase superfamily protein|nr:alginate lyase family protein [Alphaproteobacteria bacterium]
MRSLPRLLRTLWYVPPLALLWRVRTRLLQRYYATPFYNLRALQGEPGALPLVYTGVSVVPGNRTVGEALAVGRWWLAGQEHTLGMPPRTWLPKVQPLQLFELHYHEWLADLAAAHRPDAARQLLASWLLQFAHYHPTVWHPYPLSLRVVSWLTHGRWLLAEAEPDFREAFEAALRAQLRHLRRNCEWDLGGNHLIKNLKALLLGGLAVQDGALALWAESQLQRALTHQILPDGAHDERSPHYHAQVLQDVLEVRAALRNAGGGGGVWDTWAAQLGAALAFYTYPDGGLGLWNDGHVGDPARLALLVRESGATTVPSLLPAAGYARAEQGPFGLVLDAGLVGPDENPGHAHADTLAFELWHGTQRVVVNGGTLAYQHRLRGYFRSTAAHSTVELQGQNSAEVWAEHRVGRRPRRLALQCEETSGATTLRASHDGYRAHGITSHQRVLTLGATALRGEETLTGPQVGEVRAWARFHLHPAVRVQQTTEQQAILTLPDGTRLAFACEGGRLTVQPSRYAPQFNQLQETHQLAVRLSLPTLQWTLAVLA